MPAAGNIQRQNALATLLQTKPAQVPWLVLLRNTAAVILPLAAGIFSGRLLIGIAAAVGAIVTMYSDEPGPYRQRLLRLLAVSAAGGIATFLGLSLNHHLPALLVASLAIGFAGALLVTFGDAIARVGMVAMMLLVIATDLPAPTLVAALQLTAAVAAGGLLLTLLSVAAWPLQRYGPERAALSAVYRGLAALARRPQSDSGAAPALTEAMTTLQHTLLGTHRAHGPVMDSFGVLLELAERIRLELIALSGGDPPTPIDRLVRGEAATALDAVAQSISAGHDSGQAMAAALTALQSAERALSAREATLPAAPWRHFQALSGQLASAARNAVRASPQGVQQEEQAELQLPRALRPRSVLATLSAGLAPQSAAFRHAIRSAVCFSLALWISRLLHLPHGYWVPMTVAIVLRADYAATFSYGLLRVTGTILGLVLTTALLHVLPPGPWVRLAVMAVLCAGFRYFGTVHYGLAVAALTGMVVLLLAFAGEAPEPTMIARLIGTILGSAMALAAYGLWPTWERARTRTVLARLLQAYAAYLSSLGAATGPQERREARHLARIARINAEASVKRLLGEPATPAPLAELAQSLLTNSNRLARTVMTLEALLSERRSMARPLEEFIGQCAAALREVAEALRTGQTPSGLAPIRASQRRLAGLPGPEAEAGPTAELASLSDRLVDNINTLAHVVGRAASSPTLPQAA
jgi:uncharacterized membrane protein YccC